MNTTRIQTQKIIKVGNSFAVTLDKQFIDQSGLKGGDHVVMRYDETTPSAALSIKDHGETIYSAGSSKKLTKQEKMKNLSSEITPEFRDWVKNSLEEDKESMDTLANL